MKNISKYVNPEIAYYSARFDNTTLNVKECQEVACKSYAWAYYFAKYVKGANIEKCQKAACKSPKYAYWFARTIRDANIKYCQEAAYKDPYWAKKFDEYIIV